MSLIGMALSDIIDSFIPDVDVNISSSENIFALSRFFSWIKIKQVPVIILFIIFLTAFGLVGLFFQFLSFTLLNNLLSQWIIFLPVFIVSVYFLRISAVFISKVLPKDNTSSISEDDLIGHIAIITLGKASKGYPAEAKVKDSHGQTHYLMIEPEYEGIVFLQGEKVLILGKIKTYFYASNDLPDKLK
ncbi:MAG: YqiJ family protein [Campylobacterales bacterium]|nr:YqiJ family protein [Campylobacterales bacterium]